MYSSPIFYFMFLIFYAADLRPGSAGRVAGPHRPSPRPPAAPTGAGQHLL